MIAVDSRDGDILYYLVFVLLKLELKSECESQLCVGCFQPNSVISIFFRFTHLLPNSTHKSQFPLVFDDRGGDGDDDDGLEVHH